MGQTNVFGDEAWSTWAPKATPLFKWAGGKQRFLWYHRELLPVSLNGGTYHEPFAGGLSIYFALCGRMLAPFPARLADTNLPLIKTYQALADDWEAVAANLDGLWRTAQMSKDLASFYYQIREEHNALRPRSDAARFIFLMRLGWNGVYRTNLSGAFNVPFGGKQDARLPTRDELRAVSCALKSATIRATSWESSLTATHEGDFVFLDPPYYVGDSTKALLYDTRRPFTFADQEALAREVVSLQRRGIDFLLTNAAHPRLLELYQDLGLSVTVVDALRSVSSKKDTRGIEGEILVRPSWLGSSKSRAAAALRLRTLSKVAKTSPNLPLNRNDGGN